jgi:hypothetical protein
MDSIVTRRSLAIGMLAVFLFTPAADAGLSYVGQDRRVEAGTGNYGTPFPSDNGPFNVRSATGFGPFAATVESSWSNEFGDGDSARVSQSSVLGDLLISVSGDVLAGAGAFNAQYQSLFDVTFDIAEDTPYRLAADMRFDTIEYSGILRTNDVFTLVLRRLGGSDGGGTLIDERWSTFDVTDTMRGEPDVSRSGTLEAGRYALLLDIKTSIDAGGEIATYNLDFTTGGVTPLPAVPLPPAAWMGLLTLGGIVGSRVWAARRSRAAVAAD